MFDFGIQCYTSKSRNPKKDDIIAAVVKQYCIYSCKAELDQLMLGMDTLGMRDLLKKYPKSFLPLFLQQQKKLTAAKLQDLFACEFSPLGSNAWENEEEASLNWVTFLSDIEEAGGEIHIESGNENFTLSLSDILTFATGSLEISPMGFTPKPAIMFCTSTYFPIASTCSNTLTLPVCLSYEQFQYNVAFGICNSPGFQRI